MQIKTAGDYIMTETRMRQGLENTDRSLWAQNFLHIARMVNH